MNGEYKLFNGPNSLLVILRNGTIIDAPMRFLYGMTMTDAAAKLGKMYGGKFRFEKIVETNYVHPMFEVDPAMAG